MRHQTRFSTWRFPYPLLLAPPDGILSVTGSGNTETINNEFRLVSQGDSDLQWIAGVFYADEDLESTQASNAPFCFRIRPLTPSLRVFRCLAKSLTPDGRAPDSVGRAALFRRRSQR
ncbi:MAG: hypothetical protein CM15mP74_33840 [Halieaceae bacterium]|nr:MAG: hypothetical protein CM15mP74_33840 [Halieaceae bacterium]